MRTVTYKSVLDGVLRMAAEDPASVAAKDKAELMEYLGDALQRAREYYRWPELLTIEARYFRAPWAAVNYDADAEVYYETGDAYYRATEAVTSADEPGTSAKWEELEDFNRYVSYDQTGETAFDAVLGAWTKDPRVHADAVPLDFEVASEGVRFGPDAPNQVWIELREKSPDYTYGEEWSAQAFGAGDQVYDATTGELYRAAAATTADDVPGMAAVWAKIDIPYIFRMAVKRAAYADWLEADGQTDKALIQAAKFIELLDDQVSQLVKLQGQTGRVILRN